MKHPMMSVVSRLLLHICSRRSDERLPCSEPSSFKQNHSADCEMKLHPLLFPDSVIAKKTTGGRMHEVKLSEALITDVLAV